MCLAESKKNESARNFFCALCLSLANTPENNRVSKEKRSHRLSDPSTPQAGNRWVFCFQQWADPLHLSCKLIGKAAFSTWHLAFSPSTIESVRTKTLFP